MAQNTENTVFALGKSQGSIAVVGGPNDWDLWLCLRGTKPEVSFYTGARPVCIPPFTDAATFFAGRIHLLSRVALSDDAWDVEGLLRKGPSKVLFKGRYNTQTRIGEFEFVPV